MAFIDSIIPRLYSLAKKHWLIKKMIKPVYQLLTKARVTMRHVGKPKLTFPPVATYHASSVVWAEQIAGKPSSPTLFALSEPHTITRRLPATTEAEVFWKFAHHTQREIPPTFVLTIPNGRAAVEGAVITPENELLGDVSKVIKGADFRTDYQHHPVMGRKLPPAEYVEGRVAVLSVVFAGSNYFHWMLDLLPRIHLIGQAGIALDSVDYFLVNEYSSRFQRDTLTHLGIPRHKVIEGRWHPHVQARELIVPSFPSDTGHFSRWQCDWLRSTFGPESPARPFRRLYLNRRKVSYRKIINEPEIEALLARHGFDSIDPEKYSVLEQARLFSEAEVVVAPHGAALTNIVFCQPGTQVLELLHPGAVNLMFWSISEANDLRYSYLLGEGERPAEGEEPYDNFVNMRFSIPALSRMLDMLHLT